MLSLGGTVHESKGLLQAPLPAWLARLIRRLAADTAAYGADADGRPMEPNHVLINAYTAEQGIMVRANACRSCCNWGLHHVSSAAKPLMLPLSVD